MGLDMYLRIESKESTEDDKSFDERIAYWRKHGDLNAWFERLWTKKYNPQVTKRTVRFGDDEYEISAFNVERVDLTLEDLQALLHDLLHGNLPKGNGPFHTGDLFNEDRLKEDVELIANACVNAALGKKVYYICWW